MTATSEALKTILGQAPKDSKTYALMDCALDSTIYPTIQASGCPVACLYADDWQKNFGDIAPHLVELTPSAKFSTELLGWDWYGNWGYFVQSQETLDQLSAAFAPLATVKMPDGATSFFRYFDPRVIRVFLAQADSAGLTAIFGQDHRLVVPTKEVPKEPEGAIIYTLANGKLVQSETQFTAEA